MKLGSKSVFVITEIFQYIYANFSSINRRLADPLQFHVNGLKGRAEAEMQNRHSGYTNWDCNFHSVSYVEVSTEIK
jgi:hypothetical protein